MSRLLICGTFYCIYRFALMVWHPMLKSIYCLLQSSSSAQNLALRMQHTSSKGSVQIRENTGHAKGQDTPMTKPYCQTQFEQPTCAFCACRYAPSTMPKASGFRCPRRVTLEQPMPVEVRQLPYPCYSLLVFLAEHPQELRGSHSTTNTYPTASY